MSFSEKISYSPKIYRFVFIVGFLAMAFLYQYQNIFFLRPQSLHQYRQCDCLSLTLNYYQDGNNFFKPCIHNQISENGKSGSVAGEFPILYFLIAMLWKIFGYHEFIYRFVTFLIAFLGFFALYKTIEMILKDSVWAVGLSLLFFTSPILVYYSNNFLTNMPSFSFSLIGWYFFARFYLNEKRKTLYISMVFFLLAGLLKISSLIGFILIFIIFITESLNIMKFKGEEKIFKGFLKNLYPFLIVIVGNILWVIYVTKFTEKYLGAYTFNNVWPIWKMNINEIGKVLYDFWFVMSKQIFAIYTLILFVVFVLALRILSAFDKIPKQVRFANFTIGFGVLLYVLFWFNAFGNHDYYMIDLMILFIVVFVSFFFYLKNNHYKVFKSLIIKGVFVAFLLYNAVYCYVNMDIRYFYSGDHLGRYKKFFSEYEIGGWWYLDNNYKSKIKSFNTVTPYLRSIGIKQDDKVISIPDESINITLYLMNQKGWNNFGLTEWKGTDRINRQILLGAKYLIVNDTAALSSENVKPYTNNKIGQYQNISVYRLGS